MKFDSCAYFKQKKQLHILYKYASNLMEWFSNDKKLIENSPIENLNNKWMLFYNRNVVACVLPNDSKQDFSDVMIWVLLKEKQEIFTKNISIAVYLMRTKASSDLCTDSIFAPFQQLSASAIYCVEQTRLQPRKIGKTDQLWFEITL